MNHSLSGHSSLSFLGPRAVAPLSLPLPLPQSLSLRACAHRTSLTDSHSCGWKAQANVQLLQMAPACTTLKAIKTKVYFKMNHRGIVGSAPHS